MTYRVSARRQYTRCAAALGDESLARADRSEHAMLALGYRRSCGGGPVPAREQQLPAASRYFGRLN